MCKRRIGTDFHQKGVLLWRIIFFLLACHSELITCSACSDYPHTNDKRCEADNLPDMTQLLRITYEIRTFVVSSVMGTRRRKRILECMGGIFLSLFLGKMGLSNYLFAPAAFSWTLLNLGYCICTLFWMIFCMSRKKYFLQKCCIFVGSY